MDAHNSEAYLKKMVESFLEGYFGRERVFAEQRDDFARCMAFIIDKDNLRDSEEKVREAVEDIEIFAGAATPILRIGSVYGNSAAEVERDVFGGFNALPKKLRDLVDDLPSIVEFCARFLFLQRWRSGSIAREHISSLIPRLENQMKEARKLYETTSGGKLLSVDEPVKVFSLLDANQDQKKLVPLIIAKYIYREQRSRGRSAS